MRAYKITGERSDAPRSEGPVNECYTNLWRGILNTLQPIVTRLVFCGVKVAGWCLVTPESWRSMSTLLLGVGVGVKEVAMHYQ